MSAPVLSPAEMVEASRFGVHDLEVLAVMEEHADDVAACVVDGCERGVAFLARMRCCRAGVQVCDPHLQVRRAQVLSELFVALIRGCRPTCTRCEHMFPVGSMFDDIVEVVPV